MMQYLLFVYFCPWTSSKTFNIASLKSLVVLQESCTLNSKREPVTGSVNIMVALVLDLHLSKCYLVTRSDQHPYWSNVECLFNCIVTKCICFTTNSSAGKIK